MKINTKRILNLIALLVINIIAARFIMPVLMNYFFVEPDSLFAAAFAQLLGFVLPALLILLINDKKADSETVPLYDIKPLYKKVSAKGILLSVFIGIFSYFAIQYLFIAIEQIYISATGDYAIVQILPEITFWGFLLLISVMALFPSIFEELVYRGMYYTTFSFAPTVIQYIIPACVFAFLHTGLFSAFSAFVLSLILTYIMRKTQCLPYCSFIHFTNNVLSLTFSNILLPPFNSVNLLENGSTTNQFIGSAIICLCISLLAGIIVCILLKLFKKFQLFSNNSKIAGADVSIEKFGIVNIFLSIILVLISLAIFIIRLIS